MLPVVIFPDVEAWAVGYLAAQLAGWPEPFVDGVYVSNEVPNPRLDRMVIVRRDGGPRLDVARESARLGIRVWGPAENDADTNDLTQLVRALLAASPGEGPVRRYTEIAGPSTIPDESDQPLRYFTAELTARA